jgi:membrane protease YdiL (CAAX protease family)
LKPSSSASAPTISRKLSPQTAFCFYAVLGCIAVFIGRYTSTPISLYGDSLGPVFATILGVSTGIVALVSWDIAAKYFESLRNLWALLRTALGPQTVWAVFALALSSSIAEELLFRGLVQAHIGLVFTSILFGVLHKQPDSYFGIWAAFATIAGLIFGLLHDWSGGLLAPILAHFVINLVNLYRLTRYRKAT